MVGGGGAVGSKTAVISTKRSGEVSRSNSSPATRTIINKPVHTNASTNMQFIFGSVRIEKLNYAKC